ncbi:MAG: cytochrome c [Alphaproteobacteria bacterium]|nr:cytochrome c [Alphaproteobacteria bacterium]
MSRYRLLYVGWLALAITAAPCEQVLAQAPDPHQIFEQRCGGCHTPHAGDFEGDYLVSSQGMMLTRRSSRELRGFLDSGHGKLSPVEINVLVEHFESILNAGGLFQDKCRVCHDRAVDLARHQLILRDGRLTGRYTGRDIAEFLTNHGRLQPDEVERMISVLKRQLH